eukprot:1791875-Alexandrium_andersonii.AAC.1
MPEGCCLASTCTGARTISKHARVPLPDGWRSLMHRAACTHAVPEGRCHAVPETRSMMHRAAFRAP